MSKKPQFAMKQILTLCSILLIAGTLNAQVGIGTTNPTAQLTIDTGGSGIAPIELANISTAPDQNLKAGQLSVIDNELYFYEPQRGEWLSVSTMPLEFVRNGNVNSQNLFFGGKVTNQNSQAAMPFNGTIVHISAVSAGGNATKRFEIRVRNGGENVVTSDFNLIDNAFNDTNANIDFSAGDVITMRARDDGNGTVSNPTIILWVKWRK